MENISDTQRAKLRIGYTTGSCATAATKAALLALLHQVHQKIATITLPAGQQVTFTLKTCAFGPDWGKASLIKDAGDDPDATHLAEIVSEVRLRKDNTVVFHAGPGVGTFTKSGLAYAPGEPAINPVPRAMITQACKEVTPDRGVDVTISVPGGEKIAKRTLNARLGIEGGISILGTTGIVQPYSNASYIASVTQGIDVAWANGQRHLVLNAGAKSERMTRKLFSLPEICFIQYGNWVGEALTHAKRYAFEKISVCAMIGKLVKLAAGQMSLHSGEGSFDAAFLQEVAQEAGVPKSQRDAIQSVQMARSLLEALPPERFRAFYDLLCKKACHHGAKLLDKKTVLEIVLLDEAGVKGTYELGGHTTEPKLPQI